MNLQTFEPLSLRSYGHESNIVNNNKEESIHQYYVNESMKAVEAFYALPIENGVHVIILNMKLKGEARLDKPARLSFSCSLDLLLNERREL